MRKVEIFNLRLIIRLYAEDVSASPRPIHLSIIDGFIPSGQSIKLHGHLRRPSLVFVYRLMIAVER